jgi:hypothetical protein
MDDVQRRRVAVRRSAHHEDQIDASAGDQNGMTETRGLGEGECSNVIVVVNLGNSELAKDVAGLGADDILARILWAALTVARCASNIYGEFKNRRTAMRMVGNE